MKRFSNIRYHQWGQARWYLVVHTHPFGKNNIFFALFSISILKAALFSISLPNSDNPQAGGMSQGTEPNMGAAQTV